MKPERNFEGPPIRVVGNADTGKKERIAEHIRALFGPEHYTQFPDNGEFLKELNGSYTAIVGLPLYEVREALEKLGFFSF